MRQPEVESVMQWVESNQFVLSLGLHDGWTTVIYPWDDSPACTATNNAVTVEDATFYQVQDYKTFSLTSNNYICLNCISSGGKMSIVLPVQLALLYAHHHSFMHTGKCPCHPEPLVIAKLDNLSLL